MDGREVKRPISSLVQTKNFIFAESETMRWNLLQNMEMVDGLKGISEKEVILVYKHSPRCHRSGMYKWIIETEWAQQLNESNAFLIDVVADTKVAQYFSDQFQEPHNSPQLLLLKNQEIIFEANNDEIDLDEALEIWNEPVHKFNLK